MEGAGLEVADITISGVGDYYEVRNNFQSCHMALFLAFHLLKRLMVLLLLIRSLELF